MVVQFIACHAFRRGRAIVALLLTALVLLLNAMAISPALHELFHADAGNCQHQCAVTLFAHGQVDAATTDVPVMVPVALFQTAPALEFFKFSPSIENLPGGRAPPVFASHS